MTSFHHHLTVEIEEYTWPVDGQAVGNCMTWAKRKPEVLQQDLAGMAGYFPHWLLVGAAKEKPLTCPACQTPFVPLDGAMRCIKCRREKRVSSLLWLGHLPLPARPEPAFQKRLAALRKAGYGEVMARETTYLLAPLSVQYPSEWPNVEPAVRYARRWLQVMGLPHSSARHHLLDRGKACIFSWGQWRAMPIHALLQQRMVNHALSLFKIAAGQTPEQAFIGRIHHDAWQPEPAGDP